MATGRLSQFLDQAASKSHSVLAFDSGAVPSKSLPALFADRVGGADRFVQLRLNKDTVPAYAASKPCGERLLVGERTGTQWAEFRRKQCFSTASLERPIRWAALPPIANLR